MCLREVSKTIDIDSKSRIKSLALPKGKTHIPRFKPRPLLPVSYLTPISIFSESISHINVCYGAVISYLPSCVIMADVGFWTGAKESVFKHLIIRLKILR